MPVPKKKTSPSRRNMRRSHHAKAAVHAVRNCPQCGELSAMHQVCKACGFYKGREVISLNLES